MAGVLKVNRAVADVCPHGSMARMATVYWVCGLRGWIWNELIAPGLRGVMDGPAIPEPNWSSVSVGPGRYRISYFMTGAPFDCALSNWRVADVASRPSEAMASALTGPGGSGSGVQESGVHCCVAGSQTLQTPVVGSQSSVVQGATLAMTRPLKPLALIGSSRPSPEPGAPVEIEESRTLRMPVAPVQSAYPVICGAAPALIAPVVVSMWRGTSYTTDGWPKLCSVP